LLTIQYRRSPRITACSLRVLEAMIFAWRSAAGATTGASVVDPTAAR
jgi:hypothetical protein